jgi:hypothetical protein
MSAYGQKKIFSKQLPEKEFLLSADQTRFSSLD